MSLLLLGLVILVVVVVLMLLVLAFLKEKSPDTSSQSKRIADILNLPPATTLARGETNEIWPFYAKRPLSTPEQVLYFRLVEALPEHIILAQVQTITLLRC